MTAKPKVDPPLPHERQLKRIFDDIAIAALERERIAAEIASAMRSSTLADGVPGSGIARDSVGVGTDQ